jgi:hypothetical protein
MNNPHEYCSKLKGLFVSSSKTSYITNLFHTLLQQNVSLYAKSFHWILSEFINPNKRELWGFTRTLNGD